MLHPKAALGAGVDTNPLQRSRGSPSDGYHHVLAGLELRAEGESAWRGEGEAQIGRRTYLDTEGRDLEEGRARGLVAWQGAATSFSLGARWERGDQPVPTLPEQQERVASSATFSLVHAWRSMQASLGASFDDLDYREPSTTTSRDGRDRHRLSGGLGLAWLGGDDSRLGFTLSGEDVVRSQVATAAASYRGAAAHLEWRHAASSRLHAQFLLGASWRRHDHPTAHDPGNDDEQVLVPSLRGKILWDWEVGSFLWLGASSGLGESAEESVNVARVHQVEAHGRLRLADRVGMVVDGFVHHRRDLAALPGEARDEATFLNLGGGLDYRLRRGLGVGLSGSWQRGLSAASADRFMAAVGVAAAF